MTVRTCALCGNDIGLGEGFHLGTGVNREVAKHATCLAVWEWRRRAEKAEVEADAAKSELYAIVNAAGADCIRKFVGEEKADGIITAERERIVSFRSRMQKAEAEVARLRALIEEVEWSGDGGGGTGGEYMGSVCPWCQADPPFVPGAAGHRASCEAFPPGGAS